MLTLTLRVSAPERTAPAGLPYSPAPAARSDARAALAVGYIALDKGRDGTTCEGLPAGPWAEAERCHVEVQEGA